MHRPRWQERVARGRGLSGLPEQGFRAVPVGWSVIPDIIAIKDDKVYAVEVQYGKPNYAKYTDEIRKYYDDIIWILRKKWKNKYFKESE